MHKKNPKPFFLCIFVALSYIFSIYSGLSASLLQIDNFVIFLYQQWKLFAKKILIHCQWFAFFPLQIPCSQILAGFYWSTWGQMSCSAQTWGQQLFTRSGVRALLALHIRDNYICIKIMTQVFEPHSRNRCKFMAFTRHNISLIYMSKDRIWLVICMHLI